ncbi:MAG: AAA family ATPase [Prevotella sp.]|jgi:hypothetical protein|nr:AAA family ATPase [Prevotella sp.]
MRFFKVTVTTDARLIDNNGEVSNSSRREFARRAQLANEDQTSHRSCCQCHVSFIGIDVGQSILTVLCRDLDVSEGYVRREAEKRLHACAFNGEITLITEITTTDFCSFIEEATHCNFVNNSDRVMKQLGLEHFGNKRLFHRFDFDEYFADKAKKSSVTAPVPQTLVDETARIKLVRRKKWLPGHPVHYTISSDNLDDAKNQAEALILSLCGVKRLAHNRYCAINYVDICKEYAGERLDEIYKLQKGGTVVISVQKATDDRENYLTGNQSRAEEVCKAMMKFKNTTLTIFLFSLDSTELRQKFFQAMDGVSFVHIKDAVMFDDNARTFLCALCRESAVKATSSLMTKIKPDTGYTAGELRTIFDCWLDEHLKENIFKQYGAAAQTMSVASNGHIGNAIRELDGLVGLSETKTLVREILDFHKAIKLFADGSTQNRPAMHMVFSGNPGTAKTTVARIVARILKENGVLTNGHMVEVGRSNLVGQFVGWTAVQTKKAFSRAVGGVLFIDEAYSLVDDKSGSFGDEAINTIVQEMENQRDNVVVIFAGYPDKMEEFLKKNPGLRSRIGFHVNFPDYSPSELYDVLGVLADGTGLKLDTGVREKLLPIFETASKVPDFGNGRYVRNLLEKARMRQASRLIKAHTSGIPDKAFKTLVADDFESLRLASTTSSIRRMGFSA